MMLLRATFTLLLTVSVAVPATFLVSFAVNAEQVKTLSQLKFYTEESPPYSYYENNELKGIAVDLLVAAAESVKHPVKRTNITIQPWARAYRSTIIKKNTVLFSTTRTQLREDLFQWVGPISATNIVVMAKKSSNITLNRVMDLVKYRVGVIRDDVGEQLLLESGIPRNSMMESQHANTLIQQLHKGRIDLWAYEENAALWWIRQSGYDPDEFEPVFVLQEGELYYAFNKNIAPNLIDKLQRGIDKVKTNKLENGLSQYQVITQTYK